MNTAHKFLFPNTLNCILNQTQITELYGCKSASMVLMEYQPNHSRPKLSCKRTHLTSRIQAQPTQARRPSRGSPMKRGDGSYLVRPSLPISISSTNRKTGLALSPILFLTQRGHSKEENTPCPKPVAWHSYGNFKRRYFQTNLSMPNSNLGIKPKLIIWASIPRHKHSRLPP